MVKLTSDDKLFNLKYQIMSNPSSGKKGNKEVWCFNTEWQVDVTGRHDVIIAADDVHRS